MVREKQITEATLSQKEEAEMKSGGQPCWVSEQAVGEMKAGGRGRGGRTTSDVVIE